MLDETIASAQHNNSESLLALIEKFKPLLKKYAYKDECKPISGTTARRRLDAPAGGFFFAL